MGSSVILYFVMGTFFLGLLLAILALALPASAKRLAVERSLALAERMGSPDHDPRVLPTSFFERVLVPLFQKLAGLGRLLTPVGYADRIRTMLDRAGNPGRWTLERLFGVKALALLGLGFLGLRYGARFGPIGAILVPVAAAAAGFYLPDLLLYNAALKRQAAIRKSLAEAIDMLTVCVESGLGFDGALGQVARNTDGPLGREFARVLREMQLGTSRLEALRALGDRNAVPDLAAFVSAIVQADSLGIPIANILREQAKEMRLKRRQRAEEQAQQVPIKILFPVLLFIFPALFVVVVGPAAIRIYHMFAG
ncbi:type II secretion system F family protein [Flindersiella endophytica]